MPRRSVTVRLTFLRMSKLLYITNMSLDGYVEDENGAFDWGYSEQAHKAITELERRIKIHLYGRRLYETMAYWDASGIESYPLEHREFARVWRQAENIVFSRTLTSATARNTRVEREFGVEAIRNLKRESEHDIGIGGAELAGLALKADLVDECHVFVHPVILGGGKPAFPAISRRHLELLETHGFSSGVVYLRFDWANAAGK